MGEQVREEAFPIEVVIDEYILKDAKISRGNFLGKFCFHKETETASWNWLKDCSYQIITCIYTEKRTTLWLHEVHRTRIQKSHTT